MTKLTEVDTSNPIEDRQTYMGSEAVLSKIRTIYSDGRLTTKVVRTVTNLGDGQAMAPEYFFVMELRRDAVGEDLDNGISGTYTLCQAVTVTEEFAKRVVPAAFADDPHRYEATHYRDDREAPSEKLITNSMNLIASTVAKGANIG